MTTYRIWPSTTPSPAGMISQAGQYTIGTEFELSAPQQLVRIWVYSGSGETATPTACGIYKVSDQSTVVRDSSPPWSGAAASGWISDSFASGTVLQASTRYKVFIYPGVSTALNYTQVYFEAGQPGANGFTNGPLTCFSATTATNGQCSYAIGDGYPTNDAGANNYWIDVEVGPLAPQITTTSLPGANQGDAYRQTLAGTGGATPYAWSVSSGVLPDGLSLSSGGVISGTPTTLGSSSFTVKLTDADGQTATQPLSITVSLPAEYAPGVTISQEAATVTARQVYSGSATLAQEAQGSAALSQEAVA